MNNDVNQMYFEWNANKRNTYNFREGRMKPKLRKLIKAKEAN